jgi:hypothetical protein
LFYFFSGFPGPGECGDEITAFHHSANWRG